MQKIKLRKNRSQQKMEGDDKIYFLSHNLLSMLLFIVFAYSTGLYLVQSQTLTDIFSFNFGLFILGVFGLSIFVSLMSRLFIYFLLWFYFEYRNRKDIRSWNTMNVGLNRMGYSYIMRTLLGAIIFAIGGVGILQQLLFQNNSIWSFAVCYMIVKGLLIAYTWAKFK